MIFFSYCIIDTPRVETSIFISNVAKQFSNITQKASTIFISKNRSPHSTLNKSSKFMIHKKIKWKPIPHINVPISKIWHNKNDLQNNNAEVRLQQMEKNPQNKSFGNLESCHTIPKYNCKLEIKSETRYSSSC